VVWVAKGEKALKALRRVVDRWSLSLTSILVLL